MDVDTATISAMCEAHWNLGDRLFDSDIPRNFLRISESLCAKFTDVYDKYELECEYGWLEYFRTRVDSTRVVIPRPVGPLILTERLVILVMEYINGEPVEDRMKSEKGFSDHDADKIAEAYTYLRSVIKPKADELCPTGAWLLQGHIFMPFGEGGLVRSTQSQLKAYFDDRLTRAYDNVPTTLPWTDYLYAHGDLSPWNIMFLDDGRVAFLDQGVALFGPYDWDLVALYASRYDREFVRTMIGALKRKGLQLDNDRYEKYHEFMVWHRLLGGAFAR
jgi:hypothetical protein